MTTLIQVSESQKALNDLVQAELPLRNITLSGTANPTQAPGVAAPEGVFYFNTTSKIRYEKIGPLNTDWQLVGTAAANNTTVTENANASVTLSLADVNSIVELTNSTVGTGTITLPTTTDISNMGNGESIILLRLSASREWNFVLNGNTIVGSQTVKMPDAGGSVTILKINSRIYLIGAVPQ